MDTAHFHSVYLITSKISESVSTFKQLLKTFLFRNNYCIYFHVDFIYYCRPFENSLNAPKKPVIIIIIIIIIQFNSLFHTTYDIYPNVRR